MDYPLCTYALTPLDELPSPTDNPTAFTDVVGIVTGVSPTSQYHSASRSTPSTKRLIYLSDPSGFEVTLVLWGERAIAFDGEGVLQKTRDGPVLVLFVGTLVKPFEGRRSLSGGAPCRWYIDEDLPEINVLRTQLKGKIPVVKGISLPGQTAAEISAQVDLETQAVKELLDLNIWEHKKTKFYCTVVIMKYNPGERWWFHGCASCSKGTIPYGDAYKCPDKTCGGTRGMPRCRASYIGSDGTGEVELMFFDKAGKELIGKPALTLLRSKAPSGASVEDAIQFGRTDQSIPRELTAIVSRKYRLVVSVTTRSFEPESQVPSYQVHRIEMQHGKQARSSPLGRRPGLALASTSTSSGSSGLNLAGQALADSLIAGQISPLETVTAVSGASSPAHVTTSTVGSDSILLQTPPSVTKTLDPRDGRCEVDSSITKALFAESSPGQGLGIIPEVALTITDDQGPRTTLQVVPHVQSEEAAALSSADSLDSPQAPSSTAQSEDTSSKRKQPKFHTARTGKKSKP